MNINNTQTNGNNANGKKTNSNTHSKRQALTSTNNSSSCVVCQGSHKLFACEQFRKLAVAEWISIVKSNTLCFNCLNKGHKNDDCKWQGCKKCDKKHNTLLHFDKNEASHKQNSDSNREESSNHDTNSSSVTACSAVLSGETLLSTAINDIETGSGNKSGAYTSSHRVTV